MKSHFKPGDDALSDRVNSEKPQADVKPDLTEHERFLLSLKGELHSLQEYLKFNQLTPELKAFFSGQQRTLEMIIYRLREMSGK